MSITTREVIANGVFAKGDTLTYAELDQNFIDLVQGKLISLNVANGTIIVTEGTLKIPVGNTAQRPVSANSGSLRYNTDITNAEIYNGSDWTLIGGAIDANLTAISVLSTDANNFIVANGTSWTSQSNTSVKEIIGLSSSILMLEVPTSDTTLLDNTNYISVLPVSIANNVTITVSANASWSFI